MTTPEWLKNLFKKKAPILIKLPLLGEMPTRAENKVRKSKRIAQKHARRHNRR